MCTWKYFFFCLFSAKASFYWQCNNNMKIIFHTKYWRYCVHGDDLAERKKINEQTKIDESSVFTSKSLLICRKQMFSHFTLRSKDDEKMNGRGSAKCFFACCSPPNTIKINQKNISERKEKRTSKFAVQTYFSLVFDLFSIRHERFVFN